MPLLAIQRPGVLPPVSVARGGTGVSSLEQLKQSLGLQSMAYQAHTAVNILGGQVVGLTRLGVGVSAPVEALEVTGGVTVGLATAQAAEGTIQWTGSDLQGRKGGLWVSLTAGAGSAYTDEQAQDAVGSILMPSPTVTLLYEDATPALQAVVNDASITEAKLGLSDVTLGDASALVHGFLPKLSGTATHYLDGTGTWSVPPVGMGYTDEQAQDAVGAMVRNSVTVDLFYDDPNNQLFALVRDTSITEAKLSLANVTTANATASRHGFLPSLSGSTSTFLRGDGTWATPAGVPGFGLTNTVTLWGSSSSLTYDADLNYDPVNNYLGIGVLTPTAPLTFATTLGQKVHLYASGNSRYGLGIASSQLQVFAEAGATVALGYMSTTDGTTFTSQLDVKQTGIKANTRVGLPYEPPVNVWVKAGSIVVDSLGINIGDTAPRWGIDAPGQWGHLANLGTFYAPDASVDLRSHLVQIDQLGIGYAPVAGLALRSGATQLDILGLGTAPIGGWSIRAANWSRLDHVGIGYEAEGGHWLRAGATQVDYLGAGYAVNTNYSIRSGGIYCDALTCPGAVSFTYLLGIGGGADSRWNLANWGSSYFAGAVGMGYEPVYGLNLRASSVQLDYLGIGQGINTNYSLVVAGASIFNSTLYVAGTTTLASYSAVAGAPDSRFVLRMYSHIYCDGIPYSGNPGPWQAYSDRRLKRNIHEIPHPLETMTALHGVCYEYNDTADGKPAGVRMGVIAQEVEEVLPKWVGELSGYKTTQLSQFEALTIESVKALVHRLEALEETRA